MSVKSMSRHGSDTPPSHDGAAQAAALFGGLQRRARQGAGARLWRDLRSRINLLRRLPVCCSSMHVCNRQRLQACMPHWAAAAPLRHLLPLLAPRAGRPARARLPRCPHSALTAWPPGRAPPLQAVQIHAFSAARKNLTCIRSKVTTEHDARKRTALQTSTTHGCS